MRQRADADDRLLAAIDEEPLDGGDLALGHLAIETEPDRSVGGRLGSDKAGDSASDLDELGAAVGEE